MNIWLKLEPDTVTHLKLTFTAVLVSLVLHPLLGTQQMLLKDGINRFPLLKPLVKIGNDTVLIRVNAKMVGLMTIQHFER